VFSIGKNRIEIEGGLAIADSLKYLTKLKALFLFQNGIRKHAMENLFAGINKFVEGLEILDISDNFASGEAIPRLVQMIKKFKIRALNLSDSIDKQDLKSIVEAFEVAVD
jgi:Ran GTPase-activating protein (RanGAP) involved in mRNA processing and transport